MNTGLNTKKLALRNKRARRNLALKLMLEKTFEPEIRIYFNTIRKRVINEYLDTGDILKGSTFNFFTIDLLKNHYRRVVRGFGNEMRLYIRESKSFMPSGFEKKQDDTNEESDKEAINILNSIQIANNAMTRSILIDTTTGAEIVAAFDLAVTSALDESIEPTKEVVSKRANKILDTKFKGRESTIALTETQVMSEIVKANEANVLSRSGNVNPILISTGDISGDPSVKKEWAAVLDVVTRASHVAADGQTKSINDPFEVGGELLNRPGDPTGSPENVINCRCSALYSF